MSSSHLSNFHDITSGTAGNYNAVVCYDLVTGWGSPKGQNLINALTSAPLPAPKVLTSISCNGSWDVDWHTGFGATYYKVLQNGSLIQTITRSKSEVVGVTAQVSKGQRGFFYDIQACNSNSCTRAALRAALAPCSSSKDVRKR